MAMVPVVSSSWQPCPEISLDHIRNKLKVSTLSETHSTFGATADDMVVFEVELAHQSVICERFSYVALWIIRDLRLAT
jgi:hypothetical protein